LQAQLRFEAAAIAVPNGPRRQSRRVDSSASQPIGDCSVPSMTGEVSSAGNSGRAGCTSGAARNVAGSSSSSGELAVRIVFPIGDVPASERYSLNRVAEQPSRAQASSARKARPAGSGLTTPRLKCAGIPARRSASSRKG